MPAGRPARLRWVQLVQSYPPNSLLALGGGTCTVPGTSWSQSGLVPDAARRRTEGNPLAAGLVAFAAGWLVSSLLPATRAEERAAEAIQDKARDLAEPVQQELSGVASDMKDNLQSTAQESVQSVKDTATDAASTVKDEGTTQAQSVKEDAQSSATQSVLPQLLLDPDLHTCCPRHSLETQHQKRSSSRAPPDVPGQKRPHPVPSRRGGAGRSPSAP